MLAEHHSLTIDATYELLEYWKANEFRPNSVNLNNIYKQMNITQGGAPGCIKIKREDLRRWVAQADYIEDVDLPAELTELIIKIFSNPTRFQHFAYCCKKPLGQGSSQIKQYDGYCWDCDPSLHSILKLSANHLFIRAIRGIIPIGRIKVIRKYLGQNVEYSSYLYPLSEQFFNKSPGVTMGVSGTVWHDQKYPSAIEMAEFYGKGAMNLKSSVRSDWAVKSLGFAIHMLQDMGVYHHVFCKLLDGHSEFEEESLELWEQFYNSSKWQVQIAQDVQRLLDHELKGMNTFKQLGEKLVDITGASNSLKPDDTIPKADDKEAIKMTAQGIACTIKAIELF